ncbi:MAG: hypothetical protein AB7F50_01165 [Fimbriimonadaceae bacterium]
MRTNSIRTAAAAAVFLSLAAGCGGGGATAPIPPGILAYLYVLDETGKVHSLTLDNTGALTLLTSRTTGAPNPTDMDYEAASKTLVAVSGNDQVNVMSVSANGSLGANAPNTITPANPPYDNPLQCAKLVSGVLFVGASIDPGLVLSDRGYVYSFTVSPNGGLASQTHGSDLAYHSAFAVVGNELVAGSSGNSSLSRWTMTGQNLGPIGSVLGAPGRVFDIETVPGYCAVAGQDGSNNVRLKCYDGNWNQATFAPLSVPGLQGRADLSFGLNGRAYVVGRSTNKIATVLFSSGTFTPSSSGTLPFATGAEGVAADPSGKFVVVTDKESGDVQAIPIDPTTGAPDFTNPLPAAFSTGGAPTKVIAVAP